MTGQFGRMLHSWKDLARYTRFTWRALAEFKSFQASFASPVAARVALLAEAYRAALMSDCPEFVEGRLRPYVEDPQRATIWREQQIGWRHLVPQGASTVVSKGIVLKAPQPGGERGMMLLSFEYNWLPLLLTKNRDELLRRYTVLCATAWSPPAFTALWAFAHLPESDICFLISNARDTAWFQRLKTGTRVVPLYMSHWINPADYQPQPRHHRSIDILMVANWGKFKRHWALFRALRDLPPSLRVLLVGQPENGRALEHVRREAELFGVGQRVEFRERLGIEEVTRLQCTSKVALILSKREGSCVAVAEALFADTPVGLLRGAHIGSADFINPQTGVFLDEDCLADGLRDFLARSDSFTPRAWAEQNISCHVSTRKLNALLREHAARDGRPWTRDTCVLGWRPNPCYLSPTDAAKFAPAYAELRDRHGLTFALNA